MSQDEVQPLQDNRDEDAVTTISQKKVQQKPGHAEIASQPPYHNKNCGTYIRMLRVDFLETLFVAYCLPCTIDCVGLYADEKYIRVLLKMTDQRFE